MNYLKIIYNKLPDFYTKIKVNNIIIIIISDINVFQFLKYLQWIPSAR